MYPPTFSYYHERLQEACWSEWKSLRQANFHPQEIPVSAGLYRVAVMDDKRHLLALTYIGQTGRSLRERVSTLWREIYDLQEPGPAPNIAASGHWHFRGYFIDGQHFEYSVFELEEMQGKRMRDDREALESLAIMLWRQQHGIYPLVNFGSPNGESLEKRLEFVRTALLRLPLINLEQDDPWDQQWLFAPWSQWQPTTASKQMMQRGIYRVRDTRVTNEHRLEKIGFGMLAKGLSQYRPKQQEASQREVPCLYHFSWCLPDWHDYQYRALCNDLISAYGIFHCGQSTLNIAA